MYLTVFNCHYARFLAEILISFNDVINWLYKYTATKSNKHISMYMHIFVDCINIYIIYIYYFYIVLSCKYMNVTF